MGRNNKVIVPIMNAISFTDGMDIRGKRPCLVGIDGECRGQIVDLSGRTRLGRHPQNDVHLSDVAVSAFHMQITAVGGSYEVADLRSKNGTTLNGRWIQRPTILADGDTIVIAKNAFCFRLPQQECVENTSQTSSCVAASRNRKGSITSAKEHPGGRVRSSTRNSGAGRTTRILVYLTLCALQVFIGVLALRPVAGRFAGNTPRDPSERTAPTAGISPHDEQGRIALLRRVSAGRESQPLEKEVPILDPDIPVREISGQADHRRVMPPGDQ